MIFFTEWYVLMGKKEIVILKSKNLLLHKFSTGTNLTKTFRTLMMELLGLKI